MPWCSAAGPGPVLPARWPSSTAFFVIQMADVLDFAPNDATHPAFGEALREAARRGVEIVAYTCRVTPETVTLDAPVPVQL